jgi:hypothetical protein
VSNVLQFRPREVRDTAQNLVDFIELCRADIETLTADAFESYSWDVSGVFTTPGSKHKQHMHFCSWETAKSKTTKGPMREPYASFAKAYTIYEHSRGQANSFMARLTAMRALNDALVSNGQTCITALTTSHLNQVCRLMQERLSTETAYTAGGYLERLNNFVVEHRLAPRSALWRQWLPGPSRARARVGKEFDQRRQEKIPSPASFEALGSIFSVAVDTSDILVTSVCALLCGAPSRIAEVIRLPVDCEVPQKTPGGLDVLSLRWWPEKGAPPMLKPVVSSMRDVVAEALSRLRSITAEGRKLARWYSAHPGQLYLDEELEHLRGKELLDMQEVDAILYGIEPHRPSRPFQFCNVNDVPLIGVERKGRRNYAKFADLEAAVLRMLPAGFPVADKDTGLRYEDSLLVLRKLELDGRKFPYRCMFDAVEQADIAVRLGRRAALSIFAKHGFKEDDGGSTWLTTHQFRHYLNTLAQGAHLDQLDIARWSGRRSVSQNGAYDHTSGRDLLERVRNAITGEATGFGPLARLHKVTLIPRDEFARLHIPTAHTTDYGHCVHDFTMLPCQLHQDCVNCNESVCIKGDQVRERNIRQGREEARLLLDKAEAAQNDSEAGADRWLVHQKLTFERLDNLCRIFDDAAVPIGAVIQLNGVVPASRLAQAAQQRLEDGDAPDTRKAA